MRSINNSLKLIVMNNAKELGENVDKQLQLLTGTDKSFIINMEEVRFNNGEGKIIIKETIRKKDVYIICDVGNHGCMYKMFGKDTCMGPDEHFQDLKRIICATAGHANSINVIMPLLYASRQHRRKGRESLDCAMALQELESLGVREIITFDAHDANIQNAVPMSSFDNFYPTAEILEKMIDNKHINLKNNENLLVISPDTGAMDRARFYADLLGSDIGMCYKRRDLTKIVNGKNPIVAHEYMGKDVKDKDILIVDDMIASGGSILECALNLKERGANNIFLISTFALFTEGSQMFDDYYKNKVIKGVYSTNLSYVDPKIRKKKWFNEVNCSGIIAEIINTLNDGDSISYLLNGKQTSINKIKLLKRKK